MGLIVSCQTGSIDVDKFMAHQAVIGGAVMLRTQNIKELSSFNLPILGLKKIYEDSVYITPTIDAIDMVKEEGAESVAIDCTLNNVNAEQLTKYAHSIGLIVVADLSSIEDMEGRFEYDILATTLSRIPADIEFVKELKQYNTPVIAEGGYNSNSLVEAAFMAGAHYVCVGAWFENLLSEKLMGLNENLFNRI